MICPGLGPVQGVVLEGLWEPRPWQFGVGVGSWGPGGSTWKLHSSFIWVVPKIRGTILGVPITRIIVFWGLYWGPPILGNYHMSM